MASGSEDSVERVHWGSMLVALGMIAVGALGLLGILTPSPLLVAILLIVVVGLSFSLGRRWERRSRRKRAGVESKRA